MPELPEVETYKQYFDLTSLNRTVRNVEVRDDRVLKIPEDIFIREIRGNTFKATRRHGKYLFVELNSRFMVLHFGMTGDLEYYKKPTEEPPYSKVIFTFRNNHYLSYISRRMFGKLDITNNVEEFLKGKKLGPDAYHMNYNEFINVLKRRTTNAKTALMNQSILSGVGNIYSDEILFRTRINPMMKVNLLDESTLEELFKNIKDVLKFGIEKKGDLSKYPISFLIPHRKLDEKCPNCGKILQRYEISGRHGFYCSTCQK